MEGGQIKDLPLTKAEQIGKEYIRHVLVDGIKVPCDENCDFTLKLPDWYNEKKFKKGQEYFKLNRFGVLNSKFFGLLALLSDPAGLSVMVSTGKSSTPETARKRYAQTALHMLSWYECDLVPGSKSWKSLEQVRKMHFLGMRHATQKKMGTISQMELSLTAYGFMGFTVTRPQFSGITDANRDDLEAFIFFWAVICSMIGVKDEFNFCLLPFEAVKLVCEFVRRHMLIQFVQLDTPLFKSMTKAFYEGQRYVFPTQTFNSYLFLFKRICGIPGYQYGVDVSEEILTKPLFTDEELREIQQHYIGSKYHSYVKGFVYENKIQLLHILPEPKNNGNVQASMSAIHKILDLKHPEQLHITTITDSDWKLNLNDCEFYKLSQKDKFFVRLTLFTFKINHYWWGRWITEFFIDIILKEAKRYI